MPKSFVCEKLITRGSMYGHFLHDGLTRGRIRHRIIKKDMECRFHIEQKLQSHRKCIPANISGCLDTIFCQDRPAWIERSAWILISWSARKGCESVCPDRCFCLDARIDLPGYCQDTIHHPGFFSTSLGPVSGGHSPGDSRR